MHISAFEARLKRFDISLSVRPVIRAGRREYQILQEIDRTFKHKGVFRFGRGKVHVMYTPYLVEKVFEILGRGKTERFKTADEMLKEFKLPTA